MENETTEQMIDRELKLLITNVHNRVASDGYKLPDEQVLGIILAKYFGWDGTPILQTAAYAMEDANYTEDYKTLMAMSTEEI